MAGPEFFQTGMGRAFYEHHVPRIGDALEKIAGAMEGARKEQEQIKHLREVLDWIEQYCLDNYLRNLWHEVRARRGTL